MPTIRADASLKIEHDFTQKGEYIGIVTAGHPSKDLVYTAIFPFEVGASNFSYLIPLILLLAGTGFLIFRRFARSRHAGPEEVAEL
jgi:hypothetical protein